MIFLTHCLRAGTAPRASMPACLNGRRRNGGPAGQGLPQPLLFRLDLRQDAVLDLGPYRSQVLRLHLNCSDHTQELRAG